MQQSKYFWRERLENICIAGPAEAHETPSCGLRKAGDNWGRLTPMSWASAAGSNTTEASMDQNKIRLARIELASYLCPLVGGKRPPTAAQTFANADWRVQKRKRGDSLRVKPQILEVACLR